MPPLEDIDGLTPAKLKDLVLKLLEKVAALERTVAAQRDEIARLKGGPGRPNIKPNSKPSGMEQATDPKPAGGSGQERRRRGSTRSKLSIDEERKVRLTAPPPGSRFKGYTSFVVQDLVLGSHVIDFQCERWQAPDGKVTTAPLPPGIAGHFGPQLRRFVLAQYHQGQTTVSRLVTLLQALGIDISKREVVRLLTASQDGFRDEARDVLRAGLASAAWITVDDTGARHKANNGFCTQIGNAHFTAFATTAAKSRLNFLGLLRAGHGDYVVNDAALAYMGERALAGRVIARLTEHPDRYFADQQAWTAPGKTRHRGLEGQSGPRADRHRGCAVGQRPGPRLSVRQCNHQRRCWAVQCWPTRPVLGSCRAPGSQARHLHGPKPRRPGHRARGDLGAFPRAH